VRGFDIRWAIARATLLSVACVTVATAAERQIVFSQIPLVDEGVADLPDGSRLALFDPAAPENGVRILTEEFAAAGRPDLSFDGTRILFVARRAPDDPLNVWEMGLEGEAPRQITHREENCRQAIYLSTLYTLDAVEPEPRIAYCIDDGHERGPGAACAALYTCRMDGSEARRITFNPYGVGDPHLLDDGRLLYTGALSPGSGGGTALFTVHPDGTDVAAFAAVHEPPAFRSAPSQASDDLVVYVESNTEGIAAGGSLIAVRRSRSLHGRRVLAADTGGSYRSPSALSGGRMLVSYRPSAGRSYGVRVLDPARPGSPSVLFDDPEWHDVDAVVVGRRKRPAGRSSVVDESLDQGFLYCMDAYMSDRAASDAIAPGSIVSLRVFEHTGSGASAGNTEAERLLAEFPVRPDG